MITKYLLNRIYSAEEKIRNVLECPELSCREPALHIVEHHKWYISESSVYKILKERGRITGPSHIML